jgi:hypothetical protein
VQQKTLGWDLQKLDAIGFGHVEFTLRVDRQILTQAQVVAVGIELAVLPRLDAQAPVGPRLLDLPAGKDHSAS